MFTAEDIKAKVDRHPFVPLRIVTSSGEAYEVRHPDLIMVGRRDLVIGIPSKKDPTTHDHVAQISLLHVTAIEPIRQPSKSRRNGQ